MLGCAEFEELLSAHLDGELNVREKEAVSGHLRSCDSCRGALEDLKETQILVRSLKRLEAPATLWPAIERKIQTTNVIPAEALVERGPGIQSMIRKVPLFVRVSRGFAAMAASLAILAGLITLLGYVAPETTSARDSNIYLGGHAYHLMRQPLADRSSWSYVAGESNFELLSAEE